MGMGSAAFADCLNSAPLWADVILTCSGVNSDGLTVARSSTTNVTAGAVLTPGADDTAAYLATLDPTFQYGSSHTLTVDGRIDGGATTGVFLDGLPGAAAYNNVNLDLTVGAAGEIVGATAIQARAGSAWANAAITLDNAGQIRSTTGPALVAGDYAGFQTVTNRQGGFIGGINAAVGTLANAGLIDGGSDSAYRSGPTNGRPYAGGVDNSGVIQSNGAAATIDLAQTGGYIVNTGLITNLGAGPAVSAPLALSVRNEIGGVISSGGPIAIQMAGSQAIWNRGTIIGSIVNTGPIYYSNNLVDNVGGTIVGDLLLGSMDDTLIASLDLANGRALGVTGTIDGGGGTNTLVFDLAQDTVLDGLKGRVVLPTNFQKYQVRLSNDATATFGIDSLNDVVFTGKGRVVSNANLTTTGQGLQLLTGFNTGAQIEFVNNGAINFTYDPNYQPPYYYASLNFALAVDGPTAFTNNGDIAAINGGKGLLIWNPGQNFFINNGVITAEGLGVSSNGLFQNNGAIRSQTTGVSQGGSYGNEFVNTGSIEGATFGVSVFYGAVTNSGSIKATGAGAGVEMYYSSLENLVGGTISGPVAITSNGTFGGGNRVANAGVINGDIDFIGNSAFPSRDAFTDDGGMLNGNLKLGAGDDVFVTDLSRFVDGRFTGVTGVVDAGEGIDRLVLRIGADTTTTVDLPAGFEALGLVLQNAANAKVTAARALNSTLNLTGEGSLDLTADITTNWSNAIALWGDYGQVWDTRGPQSIISRGAITYTQAGAYPSSGSTNNAIALHDQATFENVGAISASGPASPFYTVSAIFGGASVTNSGSITLSGVVGVNGAMSLTNTGSITQAVGGAPAVGVKNVATLDNSGTIATGGYAFQTTYDYPSPMGPFTINNSGVIKSTGSDAIHADFGLAMTVTNAAGGEITSTTGKAISSTYYTAMTVHNEGVINGGVDVRWGEDRIENYGTINGDVTLGDGNDTFVQWVGGTMNGAVDGGYGLDTLVIDSTGGGAISTAQFVNFESFKQIGGGSLNYVGAFGTGPIVLEDSSAVVLAGDSATTTGAVTFAGGAGSEHLTVDGSISGGAALGDGVDTVVNHGSIGGAVQLGAGDDTYTEGWGSTVGGAIDGGDGSDTYILELAGDSNGPHLRSGFENLGVTGLGNLTLALDQDWDSISLAGANAYLTARSHTVGRLSGGDQDEAVHIDADIAQVNLGGGADNLQVEFTQLAGAYRGGAGIDRVRFTAAAPVTVSGSLSGFETIALDGGQMAVSGVLGAAGETTTFEGGAGQTLSILPGGKLDGTVDLGAGDDVFQLAAGSQLIGTVLGGAGSDRVDIDLIADLSLRGDQLQQFETLQVTGTGALNFTGGAAKFDHLLTNSQNLTVAAGSSLNADNLSLGSGANTMAVGGAFSGALDLGAGDDTLRLTTGGTFAGSANGGSGFDTLALALGGTDAAPTALGSTPFTGFETLDLQSGVVSVAGDYGFDTIQVRNGRLIGLAGSRLTASNIVVAQGATFGSAGAVTGNIAVAGTLSPGASPGTMTVTGDVALAAGSTALFEITPTVSDQLVVSGTVTIAQGSTLKLVGAAALTPGRRLDLITAGGGIVGAFSTIDGAQGLNLHIAQSATRLQAVGLFTTDTGFSAQVSSLIGTLNTALVADKVGAPLIAAFPALVDPATSKSDPRALARVTPQAYASAAQLALEDGLTIVDASRAQARFAPEAPGLFGFGQAIASRRTLDGDAGLGVAKGKIDTQGGLAGVGYGVDSAWAGVFVGYLNGRQRIRDLDVRTQTDSFAVGVQGQVRIGGFQLGAMAAHDGADVDTRRAAPGGSTASGDYKLKSWIADVNLAYRARLNADWAVRPRLGASYVRATRDGFVERGGGAFALTVQEDKSSTWFVDGQVEVLGGQTAGARLHPFASLGFRATADGGDTTASGALASLATPIRVGGLDRDGTLATAGAGVGYDLAPGLTASATYAGEFGDGGRQALLVGLNWKF
ncbi:autotransporter outer membrane beta-barrel domain-containing protein [Caulobacter sp. BE254]|uniref:autotransporter outer membrane beta-barrel domain-containing protein n=1 Tax=Caulobacter sp. BE254 TaxID=2817720 RepID=UPI00285E9071|nr:autotransporter outer membrane beta-barrel domain-containing protein [Caulobacter sp. BE254]MDR7116401.1 hypothetical protein [Caulobacter sp. BE254]